MANSFLHGSLHIFWWFSIIILTKNATSQKDINKTALNPNQAGTRILNQVGGKLPTGENWLYQPYFCILNIKKSYQGTLGTQELPPTGSMTSHGPSLGLTGSFKWALCFLRLCKAVFTFSKKNTLFKPSEHHGTRLWSLVYFTKVQGTLGNLHGP